jgi:hypothetical protein
MPENCLFEALPDHAAPEKPLGKPRLLEPRRDQLELRSMDIDSLIGEDHTARSIWAYVEQLDLTVLENASGRAKAGPAIPRSPPGCCSRCGSTRPARASAARGRWRGCAKATTPGAGWPAGYR